MPRESIIIKNSDNGRWALHLSTKTMRALVSMIRLETGLGFEHPDPEVQAAGVLLRSKIDEVW